MEALRLLTCTLLAMCHPAVSAGSLLQRSAGSDVQLVCTEHCHSEAVWTWVPRYPSCVAGNSSDVVFCRSTSNANRVTHQHFGDRLEGKKNGCVLHLKKAQVNDSGTFNCTANNQSRHFELDISYNCSSAQGMDKVGQQMKLSCSSESRSKCTTKKHDTAICRWMHNGLEPSHYQLRSGNIAIGYLTSEHRGLWSCLCEDGEVAVELCLEVQEEDHEAAETTSPQPDDSQSGVPPIPVPEEEKRHSSEDGDQPVPTAAVWGIAGALAAILIILLMVGVYCCAKGRKQRTTDSEKNNAQMETVEPAGRGATEARDAADQSAEQPRKAEEDTGEVQYCLLDFKKEGGRAVAPSAPETILYSEVARKH